MDEKNAVATGGTRHDGYMNVLNRFGTAQDNGEAYHFAPETMVDDMTLAAHYEGNGLFTKIIDIPAEKAATREFDLGLSDEDVKSLVTDALEDLAAVRACLVSAQRETEAMFISMNSNREN